ncbi:dimethyladenosine transferase protein, putative [Cryptosporidium muris RN66]|uniref:rRNA adenine N(6)-methyltransferase n=1 Tax=Cryptosporidium muris (strain RN66) TaxID=441375 RepID=B6ABG8_CRYMR|nr:dimethyladenosine transferase protein, putative [Cryptosporidium muris RN66]EEA05720.1 dimethyladenosine transferase protein, putative [Cryptosporidium muris RN66]|eukprot:XP_002140069.1 dimethyladenosine transferase protein [Cryptosporidium muris RN66]
MPVIRREYLVKNRPCPIGIVNKKLSMNYTKSITNNGKKSINYSHNSIMNVMLDKKKGQHLLKNPGILDKIVEASDIKPTDIVLEIGPGTGNLTMRLLPLARKVIAFDIDPRMVAEVKKRSMNAGYNNLEVKEGDALRSDLGKFDICTANLPYQISSPFVFRILSHKPTFRCAVLMFQEEFALRLLAEPGDKHYCRLTLNTKLLCKVIRVCKVLPGSFNPPPKVNSMVVKFIPKTCPIPVNFREWDGLMRICFLRKKKTIRANFKGSSTLTMLENNYKTWCSLNNQVPQNNVPFKEFVFKILENTGLESKRAFNISIDEYFKLLLEFNKNGIHFVNVAYKLDSSGISEQMFIEDEIMSENSE